MTIVNCQMTIVNYYLVMINHHTSPPPHPSPTPIVSVIIPVYNNAQFLAAALDSVIAQNFAATEIIVIDDGSTDDIEAALAPYAKQIRYVRQENAGSAAARNHGIDLAIGKYVVFLDADDLLLPGKFEAQVAILEKRPSLSLIHSGWQLIDEQGTFIKNIEPWQSSPTLTIDNWLWHKPVKMGAMLFRHEWLIRVGKFDPEQRQSQDVDLILRLALAGCTADWLKTTTMCYRIHANSTIRKQAQKQQYYLIRTLDKFFAHPDVPERLRTAEATVRYYTWRWLAWHLYQAGQLSEMDHSLNQAFTHTPFSPLHTVMDWNNSFARYFEEDKRPLSSLIQLWPHFHAAAQLEIELVSLERLLDWWNHFGTGFSEQQAINFAPLSFLWETACTEQRPRSLVEVAVHDNSTLNLPAETAVSFWMHIWSHYNDGSGKTITAWNQFAHLVPDQFITIAQLCIVYQPIVTTTDMLQQYWQDLHHNQLVPPAVKHQVVALYLTLFGQLALRRRWRLALPALKSALLQTAVSPKALITWWQFMKTAVFNPQ